MIEQKNTACNAVHFQNFSHFVTLVFSDYVTQKSHIYMNIHDTTFKVLLNNLLLLTILSCCPCQTQVIVLLKLLQKSDQHGSPLTHPASYHDQVILQASLHTGDMLVNVLVNLHQITLTNVCIILPNYQSHHCDRIYLIA